MISIRELRFCALQRPRTVLGGLHQPNQPLQRFGANKSKKAGKSNKKADCDNANLQLNCNSGKKTADQILDSDILQFDGSSEKMRINDRIDSVEDFFTTIKVTEI